MKMTYFWRQLCVFILWLLYRFHCCVNSQDADPCLVNRNTSTFDCKFAICSKSLNSSTNDIIANISIYNRTLSPCNSSLHDDHADVICPFDKQNNFVTFTINFSFRECYGTLKLKPFTSVIPRQVQQVDITSPRGRIIKIQCRMDDQLIPNAEERRINITVYKQTSDNNFVFVRRRSIIRSIPELIKVINRLHPYTNYSVEITWRLSKSNLWSDLYIGYTTTIRHVTSVRRPCAKLHQSQCQHCSGRCRQRTLHNYVRLGPTAAPQLLKGGYSYNRNNQSVFYWQGIDESEVNGPNLEYIIYKIPKNDLLLYDLVLNYSTVKDLYQKYINSSLDAVFNDSTTLLQLYYRQTFNSPKVSGLINGFQEEDIFIIRASNSFRPSTYYSAFKIHNRSVVRNPISSFFVHQKNSTHHKLRWNMDDLPIDYLYIYYCYGFHWSLEDWTECKDRIYNVTFQLNPDYMPYEILKNTTDTLPSYSLILEVGIDNSTSCLGCAIHFGISTETGSVSTPIAWNETEVSKEVIKPQTESLDTTTIIIITVAVIFFVCVFGCIIYKVVSCCKNFWKKKYVVDQLTIQDQPTVYSIKYGQDSEEDSGHDAPISDIQMSPYAIVALDHTNSNGHVYLKEVDENGFAQTKKKVEYENIKPEFQIAKTYNVLYQNEETVLSSSQCGTLETSDYSTESENDKTKKDKSDDYESGIRNELVDLNFSVSQPEPDLDTSGDQMSGIIVDDDDDDYIDHLL